jgi:hypothetical protein
VHKPFLTPSPDGGAVCGAVVYDGGNDACLASAMGRGGVCTLEKVGSARSSNKTKRVEPDLSAVSADPRSVSSSYRSPRDVAAFSSSGREQSLGGERGPPAGASLGSGGRDSGPQAPRGTLRWKWRRWLMASSCASKWEEEGDRVGMTRRSSGRGAERGFGGRAGILRRRLRRWLPRRGGGVRPRAGRGAR